MSGGAETSPAPSREDAPSPPARRLFAAAIAAALAVHGAKAADESIRRGLGALKAAEILAAADPEADRDLRTGAPLGRSYPGREIFRLATAKLPEDADIIYVCGQMGPPSFAAWRFYLGSYLLYPRRLWPFGHDHAQLQSNGFGPEDAPALAAVIAERRARWLIVDAVPESALGLTRAHETIPLGGTGDMLLIDLGER